MFTGIIEALGNILSIREEGGNKTFTLDCPFSAELKIDQSLAHNGVCLTVTKVSDNGYEVTAIAETLRKTNLGLLRTGDQVNLERCMQMNGRIDGHIVQGHVDGTASCTSVVDENGSGKFSFSYSSGEGHLTVPKGSITVNGVSLTVVDSTPGAFSVAIIPYPFAHTTFQVLKPGDTVNLEFDIIGKYVQAYMQQR